MSRGLVSGGLPLIEVEKLVDVKQREAEVGKVLAGGAGQFARGGKGELHLAEARLARQQPGVMHPFAFQRIAPGGARRLVADKAHA